MILYACETGMLRYVEIIASNLVTFEILTAPSCREVAPGRYDNHQRGAGLGDVVIQLSSSRLVTRVSCPHDPVTVMFFVQLKLGKLMDKYVFLYMHILAEHLTHVGKKNVAPHVFWWSCCLVSHGHAGRWLRYVLLLDSAQRAGI